MTDATKINRDALAEAVATEAYDGGGEVMDGDQFDAMCLDIADAVIAHLNLQATTPPVEPEVEWEGAMVCEGFDPIPITNSKDGSKAFQTLVFYGAEISKIQVARRRKAGPWEVVSGE